MKKKLSENNFLIKWQVSKFLLDASGVAKTNWFTFYKIFLLKIPYNKSFLDNVTRAHQVSIFQVRFEQKICVT